MEVDSLSDDDLMKQNILAKSVAFACVIEDELDNPKHRNFLKDAIKAPR